MGGEGSAWIMNTWVIFTGSESSVFSGAEGLSSKASASYGTPPRTVRGHRVRYVLRELAQLAVVAVNVQNLASFGSFQTTHSNS